MQSVVRSALPEKRRQEKRWRVAAAIGLIVTALAVRYLGFGVVTPDFTMYLAPWSRFIATHGGYHALQHEFADYNVPYLYLLVVLTYLAEHTPMSLLTGIKLVSVAFDGVLAWYTFRLVGLRHRGWWVPTLAAAAVLLLPSVVVDGAFWAQCDSVYAALALAGLYHVLRERPWLGCLLLGTAYAVKQQTMFVFPVLLILLLARRLPWRCLLAMPAAYLLLAVPAWIIGRPLGSLLTVYLAQTGRYTRLVLNAPTMYAFAPPGSQSHGLRVLGLVVTVVAFLALAGAVLVRRLPLDSQRVIVLAAASAVMAPFLLPAMHERYFYLADVLTVVAACCVPRRLWYVPVLVQITSIFTYQRYLGRHADNYPLDWPLPYDLRVLAVLMFVALLATLAEALRRPPTDPPAPRRAEPVLAAEPAHARVGAGAR